MAPRVFVVSGPSGVGKGTLVARARERHPDIGLTVSATTREPRPGEVEGVHYYFVDDDRFDQLVQEGAFVEWAQVQSNRYGTLKSEVQRVLDQGQSVVLEIDVQGGFNVRKLFPDARLIFVAPPSAEELERRLRGRKTETEDKVQVRLANAVKEMAIASEYDDVIVNDDLDRATDELLGLLEAAE